MKKTNIPANSELDWCLVTLSNAMKLLRDDNNPVEAYFQVAEGKHLVEVFLQKNRDKQ